MAKDSYKDWIEFVSGKLDKVELANEADTESCDIVVCRLVTKPLMFPDNEIGTCSRCLRSVQFRPHAPKKPPRICDECAKPLIEKMSGKKGFGMVVTENTMRDVMTYIKRKSMN